MDLVKRWLFWASPFVLGVLAGTAILIARSHGGSSSDSSIPVGFPSFDAPVPTPAGFPSDALLQSSDLDGWKRAEFLTTQADRPLGDECGLQTAGLDQATGLYAKTVTGNFAGGSLATEIITVFPNVAAAHQYVDGRRSCSDYLGATYRVESNPPIGDEALTVRYAAADEPSVSGHSVVIRVGDVVMEVHDTWTDSGGVGAATVEDWAQRAVRRLEQTLR